MNVSIILNKKYFMTILVTGCASFIGFHLTKKSTEVISYIYSKNFKLLITCLRFFVEWYKKYYNK